MATNSARKEVTPAGFSVWLSQLNHCLVFGVWHLVGFTTSSPSRWFIRFWYISLFFLFSLVHLLECSVLVAGLQMMNVVGLSRGRRLPILSSSWLVIVGRLMSWWSPRTLLTWLKPSVWFRVLVVSRSLVSRSVLGFWRSLSPRLVGWLVLGSYRAV